MKVYIIFDRWDGRFIDVYATKVDAIKRLSVLLAEENFYEDYYYSQFEVKTFEKSINVD